MPSLTVPVGSAPALSRPRRSLGRRLTLGVGGLAAWLVLAVAIVVALFPFFWMLSTALRMRFTSVPRFSLQACTPSGPGAPSDVTSAVRLRWANAMASIARSRARRSK